MGSLFFQDINFTGFTIVVLCGILRLVLSLFLEEFSLPGGVTAVFTTERAIQRRMFFMTFLTMFVLFFKLGALFLPLGVAVLV